MRPGKEKIENIEEEVKKRKEQTSKGRREEKENREEKIYKTRQKWQRIIRKKIIRGKSNEMTE